MILSQQTSNNTSKRHRKRFSWTKLMRDCRLVQSFFHYCQGRTGHNRKVNFALIDIHHPATKMMRFCNTVLPLSTNINMLYCHSSILYRYLIPRHTPANHLPIFSVWSSYWNYWV